MFLRYGFKKTSMDDLARAAGLSRQGLYLHFATKEALFKEAVLHLIAATRAAARAALARRRAVRRRAAAREFEAVHGHAIGQPGAEHMTELLETATLLVGPVADELERSSSPTCARVPQRGRGRAWKDAGVSAKDLAEHLVAASYGLKHALDRRRRLQEAHARRGAARVRQPAGALSGAVDCCDSVAMRGVRWQRLVVDRGVPSRFLRWRRRRIARWRRPAIGVVSDWHPYVFSADGVVLAPRTATVEAGAGYNGVTGAGGGLQPDDGRRVTGWISGTVGIVDRLQLSATFVYGDDPTNGADFNQARATCKSNREAAASLSRRHLGSRRLPGRRGLRSRIDRRDLTTAYLGRVNLTFDLRGAHYFAAGRDAVDVFVTAGALVRATSWLRVGVNTWAKSSKASSATTPMTARADGTMSVRRPRSIWCVAGSASTRPAARC